MDTVMTDPKNKKDTTKKPIKPYIIKKIEAVEILDESGEVNESTIVKLKADDGIIWNLSIGASYRLVRDLRDILDL